MINKNTFGAFIREKRTQKGMTQKELAEQLFLSESAVSKWEMGKSYPDITLIPDLCRVLDVSEHELIAGANDTEYRQIKKEARQYRILSKTFFWSLTGAYLAATVICLLCDLIQNRTLTYTPVVFSGLLAAFTFVPSCIRFTGRHKRAVFAGSTYFALVLLFAVCCIRSRQNWWGIAATGTLIGYILLFAPSLLRRYLPESGRRYRLPILLFLLCGMLLLLLCVIRCTVVFPLLRGCLMALYVCAPLLILALLCLTGCGGWLCAAVTTLASGLMLYGTAWTAGKLFGNFDSETYAVNFSDWQTCLNGNVYLLTLIGCGIAAGIFLFVGLRKRSRSQSGYDSAAIERGGS